MIVLPPRIVAKYYFMHVHGMTAEVLCGCGDDRAKQLQRNWGSGITFVTWANFPYWRWIRELTIYRPRTYVLYDGGRRVCVRRCFFGPYTWAWGDSSAVLCVWWWRGYSNWGEGITILTWANFPHWRRIRKRTIYRPRTDVLYDGVRRVCVRRCFFGPYTWAWGDSSAVLWIGGSCRFLSTGFTWSVLPFFIYFDQKLAQPWWFSVVDGCVDTVYNKLSYNIIFLVCWSLCMSLLYSLWHPLTNIYICLLNVSVFPLASISGTFSSTSLYIPRPSYIQYL